ncbi:MAG: hypothetical protein JW885_03565 [Deltaproteobacteria bacterium]|nr:hypothetical protein [Candidatus Zymogenaceae bacterium]
MSDKKKIKDIPSLVELSEKVEQYNSKRKMLKFWNFFGIKNEKISEFLNKYSYLIKPTIEAIEMPDRFNGHFAKFGWIAYESFDKDTMKEAVILADSGNLDGADNLLVEYYDQDKLHIGLLKMEAVKEFLIRKELALKAKEDYLEGRYHACIPVVLMMIDGIVNDVHEDQKGFFARDVDLTAWNSVAAHSSGLQEISRLFQESRTRTTTEQIKIPYRNGILHGRDLGYANKIVAAKTWATLFAIRDWALAKKVEKEPKKAKKLGISAYENLEQFDKKIESWKPRNINLGEEGLISCNPDIFELHTPEKRLSEFMEYWAKKNYGKMSEIMDPLFCESSSKMAGVIRSQFKEKSLIKYKLLDIEDKAPVFTEITALVTVEENDISSEKRFSAKMIHLDDNGDTALRDNFYGKWKIVNYQFQD